MIDEADYLKRKAESQVMDPAINRPFGASDFNWLSKDWYGRWRPTSDEVAHAVMRTDSQGAEIAEQYDIPQDDEPAEELKYPENAAPRVRRLMHITAFQHSSDANGAAVLYYRAVTEDGTPMIGTRSNRISIIDRTSDAINEARVVYFSPERKHHFLGTAEELPIFKETLSVDQLKLKEKLEACTTKGGKNKLIDPISVKARVGMARKRSQTKVMKHSAVAEYTRRLAPEIQEILHPDFEEKLIEAIEADIDDAIESHQRPEWAHVHAFVLTQLSENPQLRENLVAAPRWFNTAMLVLECTAVWFSLHRPHAIIHMQALFETLMGSHVLKKGEYQISIEEKSRCIQLFESYDLCLKHAMFRKPSDLAQMGAITYRLLEQALPISCYAVQGQSIAGPLPIINSMVIVPKDRVMSLKDKTSTITPHPPVFTPRYLAENNTLKEVANKRKIPLKEPEKTEFPPSLEVKKNLSFYWTELRKQGPLSLLPSPAVVFNTVKKLRWR